jgi:hypothetical protein
MSVCGGTPWASTSTIKARNSSRPVKRVAWPETTCSRRPCNPSGVRAVPSRNCTTKAQWSDSGASGVDEVNISASFGVWYVGYTLTGSDQRSVSARWMAPTDRGPYRRFPHPRQAGRQHRAARVVPAWTPGSRRVCTESSGGWHFPHHLAMRDLSFPDPLGDNYATDRCRKS